MPLSAGAIKWPCPAAGAGKTLRRTNMSDANKGTALVTGASTGMGAIYADRLARRGYDLILVARSQDKLSQLATRLGKETGRKVETVAADLNHSDDLSRVETVLRTNDRITLLINNARLGFPPPPPV